MAALQPFIRDRKLKDGVSNATINRLLEVVRRRILNVAHQDWRWLRGVPRGLAKQRAGIEDFRFHDLRHTWASWHVQSGTSLPELMELGGWKSDEMVLRYAHLAPEKLSFVAGRIERQTSKLVDGTLRGENVAKNATLSATIVH